MPVRHSKMEYGTVLQNFQKTYSPVEVEMLFSKIRFRLCMGGYTKRSCTDILSCPLVAYIYKANMKGAFMVSLCLFVK